MAIDDFPPDVLTSQLAAEERSRAGIDGLVQQVADLVPGTLGKALTAFTRRDSEHKRQVLAEVLTTVLRSHDEKIRQLYAASATYREFRDRDWPGLVFDAVKKAEQTRAHERVQRIGLILANALLVNPPGSADDVEEFLRIAMELADRDILVLREFARVEGPQVTSSKGRMDRYQAHQAWERCSWRDLGISEGDLQSICSKLESFGLISRLAPPNNLNIMADFQNRYALLYCGLRFADFVSDQSMPLPT